MEEAMAVLTGPKSWLLKMTKKAYFLIHRKVAATEMLLMGGLSTGLVSNPSRASIDAQTEKVKAALVRGESFDSGKPFSPGEFDALLLQIFQSLALFPSCTFFWELTFGILTLLTLSHS